MSVARDLRHSSCVFKLHHSKDVDEMISSDPSWNTGQGVELACECVGEKTATRIERERVRCRFNDDCSIDRT